MPRELFRRLRLAVAQDCKVAGKQLCGDSSDGCWFELRLAAKAWQRLALHALRSNPSAADDVAHWVGLHYRRNFASESKAGQVEWLGRYLESHRAAYAPE